jgi:hypothetical protein
MKARSLLLVVATAALLNGKARAAEILLDNTVNLTSWNTNQAIAWFGNATDGAAVAYTQDFSSFTFTPTQQIYTLSPAGTWNLKANTSYSFTLSTSDTTTATQLKWQAWSGTASSSYGFTQTSPFISTDAGSTFIPLSINQSPSMQLTGVVAVPEPSTCASLLAGLACGGYSLFRRRKRA